MKKLDVYFDPWRYNAQPDGNAMRFVSSAITCGAPYLKTSNELVVLAARVLRKRGVIDELNIIITQEDVRIPVDKNGSMEWYPECLEITQDLLMELCGWKGP